MNDMSHALAAGLAEMEATKNRARIEFKNRMNFPLITREQDDAKNELTGIFVLLDKLDSGVKALDQESADVQAISSIGRNIRMLTESLKAGVGEAYYTVSETAEALMGLVTLLKNTDMDDGEIESDQLCALLAPSVRNMTAAEFLLWGMK